jgi:hypothetical protein
MTHYSVEMLIGSPPQRQIYDFDTGSDFLNIKCDGCASCKRSKYPSYNPAQSKTNGKILCVILLLFSLMLRPHATICVCLQNSHNSVRMMRFMELLVRSHR